MLSSDWYDEWKDEDFEDFDEVRSGGEPGMGEWRSWKVISSSSEDNDAGSVSVRWSVAILAVGVVLGMKVTGMFQRARDRTTPERSVRVCVCVGWIAVAKAARQSE